MGNSNLHYHQSECTFKSYTNEIAKANLLKGDLISSSSENIREHLLFTLRIIYYCLKHL